MPNALGPTGLTTATQAELIANFTAAFQSIYGADINLDPDSPDGQMMMIFIQAALDNLDLITAVYNGMSPDLAIGTTLDQRVAYNGIQRQAGTYTVTPVDITADQALSLNGLDTFPDDPYTVADNAGNNWLLANTTSFAVAGTQSLYFRAENPGAVLTTLNTITVPVTVVLGVTTINNPTTYTSLGINEETDAVLRVRRQQSVSMSSNNFVSGLIAALENISGVVSASIHENVTDSVDSAGVPGHTIWVIVDGAPVAGLVAQAIYNKRAAGCGLYGSQSYNITQVDGSTFVIYWDYVVQQSLYIKFTATSIDGTTAVNTTAILAGLPALWVPRTNEEVNINALATYVQQIDPNCLVTIVGNQGVSDDNVTFSNLISPAAANKRFAVSAANITIV